MFQLEPIGWMSSCFNEKFGTPRQSGLVTTSTASLHFYPPFCIADAFVGLEQSSHLWVQFVFHLNKPSDFFVPKVRPPRLGGNQKLGVFATRSPNRPNRLGLSVVKLESIEQVSNETVLHVSGVDLVDGTPILDVKPYLPYADSVAGASHAFHLPVDGARKVDFEENLKASPLCPLIREVLQQDPRPAYQQSDANKVYGMTLSGMNIQWRVDDQHVFQVLSIEPV